MDTFTINALKSARNSFEEFCKYVMIERADGTEVPLVLTDRQKEFLKLLDFAKKNNYNTHISTDLRTGKALFAKIWEKYKESNQ